MLSMWSAGNCSESILADFPPGGGRSVLGPKGNAWILGEDQDLRRLGVCQCVLLSMAARTFFTV